MSYRDKTITCSDCACPFGFAAEDQGIAAELGFEQPVRCAACRISREATRRRSGRDPLRAGTIAPPGIAFPARIPAEFPL